MNKFDKGLRKTWGNIRDFREDIVLKIFSPLIRFGLSADIISFIGLGFGIVSVFFLGKSNLLFFFFWSLKRFADIIDGPIARANNVKLIDSFDVDQFCDLAYNVILFVGTIPIVGILLPTITLTLFLIHLIFDYNEIGANPFVGPSNYSSFLFFFGKIEEGLYLQITYTIIAFAYNRIKKL